MAVISTIALIKAILPWAIKAALIWFGLRTGVKVAAKASDETAEAILIALFGEEELED